MSLDGLFDSGSFGALQPYSSGSVQPMRLFSNTVFSSPGLSLGLQMNTAGQGEMTRLGNFTGDVETIVKNREDENESRSGGSDNLEGGSGDDIDQENPRKKKRYHRHTPQQIQELEALFKECPHPDDTQRMELSKRLCLDARQVKFWFQNRRTQMKTQIERHENSILRTENDKLRAENLTIREAMRSPVCGSCGSPAMLGEVSLEEQHLRIENARLKDEFDRVCALASRFLCRPMSALTSSFSPASLDIGVGFTGVAPTLTSMGGGDNYNAGSSMPQPKRAVLADCERSVLLELALAAMDELVKMAQMEAPFWIPNIDCRSETLNLAEYSATLHRCVSLKPAEFVSEATRETGIVLINSMILIDSFMDGSRWAKMFPCIVAKAGTIEIISNGMGGTRNGALQLMQADLQVLTPLVPVRKVSFLRFCKQHAEGVWGVVDVSVDGIRETLAASGAHMSCRRLPSGFLVQAMPSGYSKVTWVEHAEYDETAVHQLYRPPLRAGLGLGARRWLLALQRQAECLAIMAASSPPPSDNPAAITVGGRRSMLRLAGRMTENFCAGVCAWAERKWRELRSVEVGEDMVRVMTRQSVDDPGEPPGVVLSAATSVWLPMVSAQRLFEFLRDEQLRREWDILSNGSPMQEVAHIAKGQNHGNAVSLLRATVPAPAPASAMATNGNQKQEEESMLILQETSTDAAGSLVVYAPVDAPAINLVMNGGDSSYVALLPSGFAILPDGIGGSGSVGGSLLTVAFQILVTTFTTAELTVQSVDTVKSLISCTVLKIKSALTC